MLANTMMSGRSFAIFARRFAEIHVKADRRIQPADLVSTTTALFPENSNLSISPGKKFLVTSIGVPRHQ